MNMSQWLIAVALVAVCLLPTRALAAGEGKFVQKSVNNPVYHENDFFAAYDDYHNPRMAEFRKRYNLDAVLAGKTDEWERILALRGWLKSKIAIENDRPTRVRMEEFAVMDKALEGGKFHCGHFTLVFNATLNSCGYFARRAYCGPGTKETGAHALNEVWVNKFSKWVLVDSKYNQHFEKNGVPLSVLEVRDELLKDGGKSVVRRVPEGTDLNAPEYKEPFGPDVNTYRFCAWDINTNRFSSFPVVPPSAYFVWDDKYFQENTWYYEGNRHWAYDAMYFIKVPRREWIEWTPNVIASNVKMADGSAEVNLKSFTPNFKTYQTKSQDGQWTDCGDQITLPLEKKPNRFVFRAVNLFGVMGPEHRVEIDWQQ